MLHLLHGLFRKFPALAIKAGMIATFLLVPFWLRFPNTKAYGMGDFAVFYSAGFVIFWPIIWTLFWWVLSRFAGFNETWGNKTQRSWIIALFIFAGWILLSWTWSYKRISYPSVAVSAALPFILVLLFAICLCSVRLNSRIILSSIAFGLFWNSIIASLQVATQHSLRLKFLGEFQFDPAASGTVIVQADGIRWLRPYGLLPHPNMLAGFLLIGLFATLGWVMAVQSKRWIIFAGLFAFGFWTLLLSFSRSAWLGLASGLLIFAIITFQSWWNNRSQLMRLLLITGITLIASGLFIGIYQPFLAARAGISDEALERRSSSDRVIYNQIALEAIRQSPILGAGIGNYPWYASDYLVKTDFDLRGQPVHNIFLSAWAELGVVGLGIFIAAIGLALLAGIKNLRQAMNNKLDEPFLYATAIAATCALLVIGLFDHYPWTLIQFQIPFWGLMAVIVRPPSTTKNLA